MADVATSLRDHLVADPDVNGIVADRLYWDVVPQGAVHPYVRLQIISDPRTEHLKGYDNARRTRVQASIFADKFGTAKQLGVKIVHAVADPWDSVGRVKCEGPRSAQGDDLPGGFVHHQIVEMIIEHSFAD